MVSRAGFGPLQASLRGWSGRGRFAHLGLKRTEARAPRRAGLEAFGGVGGSHWVSSWSVVSSPWSVASGRRMGRMRRLGRMLSHYSVFPARSQSKGGQEGGVAVEDSLLALGFGRRAGGLGFRAIRFLPHIFFFLRQWLFVTGLYKRRDGQLRVGGGTQNQCSRGSYSKLTRSTYGQLRWIWLEENGRCGLVRL